MIIVTDIGNRLDVFLAYTQDMAPSSRYAQVHRAAERCTTRQMNTIVAADNHSQTDVDHVAHYHNEKPSRM